MKIDCIHGYFKFRERNSSDISRFNDIFGFGLMGKEDYYTFPFLVDAPEYSFNTKDYMGLPARSQYAGDPWDVMRANDFVFDFSVGTLKKIETIRLTPDVGMAGPYYVSSGLILPGSLWGEGKRVTDYSAIYSFTSASFRYSKVVGT